MDYQVVYDIAQCGYDWSFAAFGLLFVFIGLVLWRTAFRKSVRTPLFGRLFAIVFLGFSLLWTVMAGLGTFRQHVTALSACERGECAVVEGVVEQFQAMPSPGPQQK